MTSRKKELQENLNQLQSEIAAAAHAANRDPAEIELIAISKTWPASDVRLLSELGVQVFGENRAQEAALKAAEITDLNLEWHHVGQVQTNKASQIVSYANFVHSIDRPAAAFAINKAAAKLDKQISVFIQVALDESDSEHRAGVEPSKLLELAEEVQSLPNLILVGLMAVAPLGQEPEIAFQKLQPTVKAFRSKYPLAQGLSIGMSGDFKAAIAAGATHIRIGSILFGNRAPQ